MVGLPAWSLMMLPNHTDSPGHFDIGFNTALDSGRSGVAIDCISGVGPMRDAVEQALRIWIETSGACFLELLTMKGKFATHLHGSGPDGIPGWHAVASRVTGYSHGTDESGSDALRDAMVRNAVLNRLADRVLPLLTRPASNGIKIFYFRKPDAAIAEIRVNGVADAAALTSGQSRSASACDAAIVRCYAVATHRV